MASSALTSGRPLRSPSFSTVALSGVEIHRQFAIPNSRNNGRTCLRSGCTPISISPHSSVLPSRSPCRHLCMARSCLPTYRDAATFVSSVELARHKTWLGNWVFLCSFVCNHPIDADHVPLFVPFHGFPGDNKIHLHPLTFPCISPNHHHCQFRHLPQHSHRVDLQLELKIRARVPGCSSSSFTILSVCARFTPLPDETPGEFSSSVLLTVCTLHAHHCLTRLPERSELKSNLTESHRTAQQGSLERSLSHLHLGKGNSADKSCSDTSPWFIFNFCLFSWWSRHDTRFQRGSSWIVNSFHLLCIEIHLSLFCTLSSITIHKV